MLRLWNVQRSVLVIPLLHLEHPPPGAQLGQLFGHHLAILPQIRFFVQVGLVRLGVQLLPGGEDQGGINYRTHIGGVVKGQLHAEDELPELYGPCLNGLAIPPGLAHCVQDFSLVRVGGQQAQLLPHKFRHTCVDELPQNGSLVPSGGTGGDREVLQRRH